MRAVIGRSNRSGRVVRATTGDGKGGGRGYSKLGKHTNEASDTKQGRGQGELRVASVEGPYHIFSKQSRYLLRSNHSACLLTTGDISNAWRSAGKQMTTLSATFFSRFLTMGCFASPSVRLATENSYHCSALPRLHRGWQRPCEIAFFSYSFLIWLKRYVNVSYHI